MNDHRIAVLYKSKYGSTELYAKWIGDALDADVMKATPANLEKTIMEYDTIIYGGNLCPKGINGIDHFKAKMRRISDKNVVVFAVGSFPPSEYTVKELLFENFPEDMRDSVNFYHLRGRFDFVGMSFLDRVMIKGLKHRLLDVPVEKRTPIDEELLDAFDEPTDWMDIDSIKPLVDFVKSLLLPYELEELEARAEKRLIESAAIYAEEKRQFELEQERRAALYASKHKAEEAFEEKKRVRRLSKKQRLILEKTKEEKGNQ